MDIILKPTADGNPEIIDSKAAAHCRLELTLTKTNETVLMNHVMQEDLQKWLEKERR